MKIVLTLFITWGAGQGYFMNEWPMPSLEACEATVQRLGPVSPHPSGGWIAWWCAEDHTNNLLTDPNE